MKGGLLPVGKESNEVEINLANTIFYHNNILPIKFNYNIQKTRGNGRDTSDGSFR